MLSLVFLHRRNGLRLGRSRIKGRSLIGTTWHLNLLTELQYLVVFQYGEIFIHILELSLRTEGEVINLLLLVLFSTHCKVKWALPLLPLRELDCLAKVDVVLIHLHRLSPRGAL